MTSSAVGIFTSTTWSCCLHLKYFPLSQSVNSRLETLERRVASQQDIITAQQALLNTMVDTSGGLQSYNLAQVPQSFRGNEEIVLYFVVGQV